uniref:UBZ4-type domain-containing protein n=1 Tax=Piliocolobus tephrosceles TaxID=591936 RepID=A0A8C9H8P8_9PRIM
IGTKYSLFPCRDTKEISELRKILTQMQPGTLGRSAHMVLSAARRVPPVSVASPKNNHAEPGSSPPERAGELLQPLWPLTNSWSLTVLSHRPLSNSNSRPNRRETARARQKKQAQRSGDQDSGLCPICAGSFRIEILPQHAAACGETSPPHPASPSSSSSSQSVLWVSSPESLPPVSWVQCPICQLQFSAREIEEHASICGDFPQA